MYKAKISHAKLKKDEAIVNMVLIITTKSQNPRLVLMGKRSFKKPRP